MPLEKLIFQKKPLVWAFKNIIYFYCSDQNNSEINAGYIDEWRDVFSSWKLQFTRTDFATTQAFGNTLFKIQDSLGEWMHMEADIKILLPFSQKMHLGLKHNLFLDIKLKEGVGVTSAYRKIQKITLMRLLNEDVTQACALVSWSLDNTTSFFTKLDPSAPFQIETMMKEISRRYDMQDAAITYNARVLGIPIVGPANPKEREVLRRHTAAHPGHYYFTTSDQGPNYFTLVVYGQEKNLQMLSYKNIIAPSVSRYQFYFCHLGQEKFIETTDLAEMIALLGLIQKNKESIAKELQPLDDIPKPATFMVVPRRLNANQVQIQPYTFFTIPPSIPLDVNGIKIYDAEMTLQLKEFTKYYSQYYYFRKSSQPMDTDAIVFGAAEKEWKISVLRSADNDKVLYKFYGQDEAYATLDKVIQTALDSVEMLGNFMGDFTPMPDHPFQNFLQQKPSDHNVSYPSNAKI